MANYKLYDYTEEVKDDFEFRVHRALDVIAQNAQGYATLKCPVGTPESTGIPGYIGGTLKQSIASTVRDNMAYIGTNVQYAPYVEKGTSKMKARPYLKPAAEDHAEEYMRMFQTFLNNN